MKDIQPPNRQESDSPTMPSAVPPHPASLGSSAATRVAGQTDEAYRAVLVDAIALIDTEELVRDAEDASGAGT